MRTLLFCLMALLSACAHPGSGHFTMRTEVGYQALDPLLGKRRVWAIYRLDDKVQPGLQSGDRVLARLVCGAGGVCKIGWVGHEGSFARSPDDAVLAGHVMGSSEEQEALVVKFDVPIDVPDEELLGKIAFQPGKVMVLEVRFSRVDRNPVFEGVGVAEVRDGQPLRWK